MTQPNSHEVAIHKELIAIARGLAPSLCEALQAVGPLCLPKPKDGNLGYFLSRAVVGQQLSTRAAATIWGRVEGAVSSAHSHIPEFFNDQSFETIRGCGVSGSKVKALQGIREAQRADKLCGKTLAAMDHAERSEQLQELWGIGQWTCDMASMFFCRCPDVWPEGDVTVQKIFKRLIGRRKPSKTAKYFAPHRSYLALTMWEIADARPEG
jgi:DNA-3-methyladenine glycosylase II